jgi:hypothetical protein
MRKHHARVLWTHFTNITLGVWLMAGTALWEYGSAELVWSDLLSGALLVVFGTLSLRFDLARWGVCAAGLWLLFAPLVFWAPAWCP